MIPACLLFLAAFGFYIARITPSIALEDSGEFATAAATLSITHPPGYPLYILAGKLFSLIPVGSPGFRLALFSAASAGVAACLLADFSRRLCRVRGWTGIVAGAAFALTPALVAQASLSNKYAFNVALLCLLFILGIRVMELGSRALPALFLGVGISLSHHMQTVYIFPALFALLFRERLDKKPRTAALLVAVFLLGISIKPVVLPLSSAAVPSLMYGKLDTARRLLPYLSAREYSGRFTAFSFSERITRLWSHGLKLALEQAGLAGVLLSVVGAVCLWKARRGVLLSGLAGGAVSVYLVSIFQIAGVEPYYVLPFTAFIFALAGAGLAGIASRHGRTLAALAAAVLFSESLARGLKSNDLSRYFGSFDRGRNILKSAERGAVLLTQHDDELYPAMYLSRVLMERVDVVILHRPFITRLWHHEEAGRLHPGFAVLDSSLIPWGRTVQPEEIVNIFFRSHLGKREVALTYVRPSELAGGFRLTPHGCVFKLGRIGGPPPPRAAEFKAQLARFSARGAFEDYENRDQRFREVAGTYAGLWSQLAALWINQGDRKEARKCIREASLYRYNRISAEDVERLLKQSAGSD